MVYKKQTQETLIIYFLFSWMPIDRNMFFKLIFDEFLFDKLLSLIIFLLESTLKPPKQITMCSINLIWHETGNANRLIWTRLTRKRRLFLLKWFQSKNAKKITDQKGLTGRKPLAFMIWEKVECSVASKFLKFLTNWLCYDNLTF